MARPEACYDPRMRSRRPILLGLIVLLAVVALSWWRGGEGTVGPSAPEVRITRPSAPTRREPARDAAALPDTDTPLGPEEEALQALGAALGLGWVACPAPAGLSEVQSRLIHPVRRGDAVVGLAPDPSGLSVLYPPTPSGDLYDREGAAAFEAAVARSTQTVGAWRWGDAFAGEAGWCVLDPPSRVRLSGTLVLADPPPERVGLNGCGARPSDQHVDADGRWTMWVDRGEPCKLEVNSAGFEGTWVDRSRDQAGIVVVQPPDPQTMAELVTSQAQELRAELARPDPAVLAADGEVSDAARAVLARWGAADRAELERRAAFLERAAADRAP